MPQTNTFANFSSVRSSLDIACNQARRRSVVMEIICSPWLVHRLYSIAGRRKNLTLSLPDLLEHPTMAHITIFTHQLHEKLRLLVRLQANSRQRFRRCSTIWLPRLVTIVSEKLYTDGRSKFLKCCSLATITAIA